MSDRHGNTTSVFIPARPTTYNGIGMRSRLEARYASWLDKAGIAWQYEPNAFASAAGQYLPDFRLDGVVILGSEQTVYVDVKPTATDVTHALMYRMAIIWESEPHAWCAVEVPGMNPVLVSPPELGRSIFARYVWTATAPTGAMGLVPFVEPTWWKAA